MPTPWNAECSAQPPAWNLSLARAWFVPSVQLAASAALLPCTSKPGFNTRLLLGMGVLVCVAAGGVIAGLDNEMSSNKISPVGDPSVIRRSVTFVFEPLFHVPVKYCQLPEM